MAPQNVASHGKHAKIARGLLLLRLRLRIAALARTLSCSATPGTRSTRAHSSSRRPRLGRPARRAPARMRRSRCATSDRRVLARMRVGHAGVRRGARRRDRPRKPDARRRTARRRKVDAAAADRRALDALRRRRLRLRRGIGRASETPRGAYAALGNGRRRFGLPRDELAGDSRSSRSTPAARASSSTRSRRCGCPNRKSYAGSVTQIRDCTQALMEFAKRTGCAAFIVGHVTKDGAIAGPRLLEHLVDTVLYFEGETSGEYRIVRAYKNRFGSIDEICVFAMHDDGLREVANPSRTVSRRASATPERFVRRRLDRRIASGARRSASARRRGQLRHAAAPGQQSRSATPGDDSRGAGAARRILARQPRRLSPRSPADCASSSRRPISASHSRSHRRFATSRLRRRPPLSASSASRAKCAPSARRIAAKPRRASSATRT